MILRRLADALGEQNWFTVVLEVSIVVVGIFIGLQVDNWNQARKDRIDESAFISRLHEEIEGSSGFLQTLWERQQTTSQSIISALDIVFARSNRDELTGDECSAIGRSAFLLTVTVDLPSVQELTSSGRITVVQDVDMRLALARSQQLSASTRNILNSARATHLFVKYPEIVQTEGYWSEPESEVRLRFQCDLLAMRKDKEFLSDLSLNADSFDAVFNKGTQRELDQLERIHALVDLFLGISHQRQTR